MSLVFTIFMMKKSYVNKMDCIVEKLEEAEKSLGKALQSLADAKKIHDEWEVCQYQANDVGAP